MWDWSDAAAAALAGGHTAVSRVDVLHNGQRQYTLDVVGGRVEMTDPRPVRSNLSASLIDPTGELSRGDVEDLLNPYECEVAPWRGVRIRDAWQIGGYRDELAPLGVFALTGRQVSDSVDGLTISLAGQDRAMGYQGPMSSALAIPGGTPVEDAIAALLSRANASASLLSMSTGYTCGPLLFPPDIDVWAEAQELAQSVGAQLFHDRTGGCVLAPAGPSSPNPVAFYGQGGGLLLGVERSEDSDTIKNVVVAETPLGSIRAVAEDDDPSSPTFTGGRYGRRTVAMENQHFASVRQAQQAATARLAYELGRSETVSMSVVPNAGLDINDVVTAHRPRAGLLDRALVVSSLIVPLGVAESMAVGCRRSVLTRDGRVLEPLAEVLA